jgi:hypothetical protein
MDARQQAAINGAASRFVENLLRPAFEARHSDRKRSA